MNDVTNEVIGTVEEIQQEDTQEETGIVQQAPSLKEESLALIEKIIIESDEQKTRDLTHLFNVNQNKKTMVRVNKLSNLLDSITDQALLRFSSRPDEISNKELFDGLKIVQDLIERGQKQVSGVTEVPLITVNQQNNEVNIGSDNTGGLSRDSRERVKNAVMGLLNNLNVMQTVETGEDIIDASAMIVDEEVADDGK